MAGVLSTVSAGCTPSCAITSRNARSATSTCESSGWRVVSFPSPKEPATSDDDLTILGYEFILEKMEEFDD